MTRTGSSDGYIKGYKDVPSLAAIRDRVSFSKASAKSVGSTSKEETSGNKENVQPPSTSGSVQIATPYSAQPTATKAKVEHPLQHSW